MERLIDRYEKKLIEQGLAERSQLLMAEIETERRGNSGNIAGAARARLAARSMAAATSRSG